MNLETEIERLAEQGASEQQILNLVKSRLERRNGSLLHADSIDIHSVRCSSAEVDNVMFAWLRQLEIAAAPEVVRTYAFGDNCIVVRRYWACPGEKLIELNGSGLKLKEDARTRFLADMQRLFDHGKLYPYIRGDAHWLVSEKTGVIVLSPWLLSDAEPKDREEHFESIERTFARYS